MNTVAFVLALIAIVVFLVAHFGRPARLSIALGLAIVTLAWTVQLVVGGADVHIH